MVPSDYERKGYLNTQWQSDGVPFTATVQAISPDHSTVLISSSQEFFEDYVHAWQKQMVLSLPSTIRTGIRDFVEPEIYLQQYAQQVLNIPLTPVAKAALPSIFGKNLEAEKNTLRALFEVNSININVRMELSNLVCDAILMKFTGQMGNRKVIVLAGADWQGVESYDANRVFSGIQNMFGNPFASSNTEKPKNMWEFFKQGGLIGQMQRNRNAAAQNA